MKMTTKCKGNKTNLDSAKTKAAMYLLELFKSINKEKFRAQFISCSNLYQIFTMVFLKGLFVLTVSLAVVNCAAVTSAKNKTEPAVSKEKTPSKEKVEPTEIKANTTTPCTCGVFLTSQFVKGSDEQPKGDPAMIQEINKVFPCNVIGQKQCQTKCLEAIVGHLPNSATVLCATLDRDCHKERAYLFIKNCKNSWVNTNLAAGKEYCCKDGTPYSCPLV